MSRLWPWAIAAALLLGPAAHAAVIDDVVVAQRGGTVVATVVFSVPVRVTGATRLPPADVFRVPVQLGQAGGAPVVLAAPELRPVIQAGAVGDFSVALNPGVAPGSHELVLRLRQPLALELRQGSSALELNLVFTGADPAGAAEPVPPPVVADDAAQRATEHRAEALLNEARQAMAAKRHDDALQRLNQLLQLPPNRQSQAAQALIGDAWLAAGDTRRARLEYELYLKLYPQGPAAGHAAEQLAALGGTVPRATAPGVQAVASATKAGSGGLSTSGSIAQYFNAGRARSQSLVNLAAGIDQATLSNTTESSLVTSLDLSARYDTPDAEIRAVLRGSGATRLGTGTRSQGLLGAAYVDYRRTANGLAVRVGRQSAISGGLLGMFDGVSLTYPWRGVKFDLMGGVPANTLVSSPSQRLLAAMVEFDSLGEHWGGNVYLVDQTSEGFTNRRALGAELRYSDEAWSGYALLDYDVLFRALNAVTLQASWQAPGQTTITLMLDDRKAPSIALNNALISSGRGSLAELLAQPGASLAQARQDALRTSAQARQALISVSRPLSERWQAGADLRYSMVGALPEVGDFAATESTGAQVTASVQLTGTNLYSGRDINSFNASVITTPLFKGLQLSYSNLTGLLNNDLTLEPSLRLYLQRDTAGVKVQRISPGLRVTYRWSKRANLLGEVLVERSTTDGPGTHGTTDAASFYLGYRYELF